MLHSYSSSQPREVAEDGGLKAEHTHILPLLAETLKLLLQILLRTFSIAEPGCRRRRYLLKSGTREVGRLRTLLAESLIWSSDGEVGR